MWAIVCHWGRAIESSATRGIQLSKKMPHVLWHLIKTLVKFAVLVVVLQCLDHLALRISALAISSPHSIGLASPSINWASALYKVHQVLGFAGTLSMAIALPYALFTYFQSNRAKNVQYKALFHKGCYSEWLRQARDSQRCPHCKFSTRGQLNNLRTWFILVNTKPTSIAFPFLYLRWHASFSIPTVVNF